ncbi:hypothetical protein [Adhaeribacter pallidiroseus]|uniref:Uncharacterized protein n=1 Tax=Adhaeribacter pallidiroseus TaxID=2072847 RepID=A0A369QDU5_9BACT|nr:hypothetical protein [Adhaeribacter pallidiroseus]RDC62582.1 hypothetical protein AHMF7616_01176 [Adhaeribacter pallidiroseus]
MITLFYLPKSSEKRITFFKKYFEKECLLWLIILLSACCPDVDQNLNSKIKSWAPYFTNQEVVFQNEKQDSILFRIKKTNRTEIGHDKVCGNYDIETVETMLFNPADTTFQFKIALTQEVLLKLDSYRAQPRAKNLTAMFNTVSEQFVSDDWRDRYLSEISLNGKTYKNVLHIYANFPVPGTSFLEIYYAQHVGLVAFSDFQGIWYYLK